MERLNIVPTFGAAYIGSMAALILYGITTLQTYLYFLNYPRDERSTKLLVLGLWILDTMHIIFINHAMYHYLVSNYANPLALIDGTWSLYVSIALNVTIAVVVESFFTKRIYELSRCRGKVLQRSLTLVTALAVAGHFALGIDTVVEMFLKKQLARLSEITWRTVLPFALLTVLSDVLVAGALCGLLWHERSDFGDTNALIGSLIVWAINRCLLTSILAIIEMITFAARPNEFWYLAVDFVVGKLYANSLLATLNSRKALKVRGDSRSRDTDVTTSFRMAPTVATDVEGASGRPVLRILPPRDRTSEDGTTELDELHSATPLKCRTPSLTVP